ncbi:hypothetical protein M885DRAFT_553086 [Pelagophyceae sp. CCMP2097]|nr:hypothetical protein M885DRAFT_553088 [Pelagophyceae sp. CCMP2097]KAJ1444381.1 hypothetical protein M885DRAFT_553086 [Pelagophyceae sp. CCMP2097]|mmetsp:Transcript_17283/g.58400  ORF Transcript_17283/g.58400 Transcript_17283/m.58400 type:complete len:412 (-) Transcript_17283:111-1346(-)
MSASPGRQQGPLGVAGAMTDVPDVSDQVPQAWVMCVNHYMDNCSGTNKSKFMVGGLGLLVLMGHLAAIRLKFMITGHTKFESDVVAQKTAGRFNANDCFNHGMLNFLFASYVTAKGYCGDQLRLHKECTSLLFAPVNNITKYRELFLLGDDGEVQQDLVEVQPGDEAVLFADTGTFYTDESLATATVNLAERTLLVVLPIICDDEIGGIDSGVGIGSRPRMVPFRKTRLFMRPNESVLMWREQPGYHLPTCRDDAAIDAALAKIVSYSEAPAAARAADAPYWGDKAKQLNTQYANWVPPQHVPDHYDLSASGQSRLINDPVVMEVLLGPSAIELVASSTARASLPKARRYSKAADDAKLIRLCGGIAPMPKKAKTYHDLGINMGADSAGHLLSGSQIQRAVQNLLTTQKLQ